MTDDTIRMKIGLPVNFMICKPGINSLKKCLIGRTSTSADKWKGATRVSHSIFSPRSRLLLRLLLRLLVMSRTAVTAFLRVRLLRLGGGQSKGSKRRGDLFHVTQVRLCHVIQVRLCRSIVLVVDRQLSSAHKYCDRCDSECFANLN
jgi:hypothetical protein